MRRQANVSLLLVHRLRRWPKIKNTRSVSRVCWAARQIKQCPSRKLVGDPLLVGVPGPGPTPPPPWNRP